jgi:predicted amidophosphoribosyltransferase
MTQAYELMQSHRFFRPDAEVRFPNMLGRISYFQRYYPARGRRRQNEFSTTLLDLKKRREYAIEHFAERLIEVLEWDFVIAVAPSSDPEKVDSGIRAVAEQVLEQGYWVDATDCLIRRTAVEPAHRGGSREWDDHYESIELDCPIIGQDVLLLDDITTTGTSLKVCREILLECGGARSVKMMAMGKTIEY